MSLIFHNFNKQRVTLGDGALEHILTAHPEISLEGIKAALEDPDEVRVSSYRNDSELYYLRRTKQRYTCVVVRVCGDGNFISTALTTTKPKNGRIIFRRGA